MTERKKPDRVQSGEAGTWTGAMPERTDVGDAPRAERTMIVDAALGAKASRPEQSPPQPLVSEDTQPDFVPPHLDVDPDLLDGEGPLDLSPYARAFDQAWRQGVAWLLRGLKIAETKIYRPVRTVVLEKVEQWRAAEPEPDKPLDNYSDTFSRHRAKKWQKFEGSERKDLPREE